MDVSPKQQMSLFDAWGFNSDECPQCFHQHSGLWFAKGVESLAPQTSASAIDNVFSCRQ
jgi:hypothetical protein